MSCFELVLLQLSYMILEIHIFCAMLGCQNRQQINNVEIERTYAIEPSIVLVFTGGTSLTSC